MANIAIDNKIRFRTSRSPFFRVVYAEGAWGGVSPRGNIQFTFYNERSSVARITSVEVAPNDDGTLMPSGEETPEEPEFVGIDRAAEVQVIMNLGEAEAFHNWLGTHIASLRGLVTK